MIALFLIGWLNTWIGGPGSQGDITIRFENLDAESGTIRLALYGSKEDFMQEDRAILYNFPVEKSRPLDVKVPEVTYGTYAFAVFLDENNNNKLDKNLLGIPTESYGFSRAPDSKWRLPDFEEVKFQVGPANPSLKVKLIRWKW